MRVIDVVTINSISLLPIIEIHINPDGKMRYTLVGCPALGNLHTFGAERSTSASGDTYVPAAGGVGPNKGSGEHCLPAIGGIAPIMFRFHSAEKLVRMVHAVENSVLLKPLDHRYRLAMTMADGAIQGPGSVGFEEEEAKVDKRHGLPVGVCQCHRLDNAGSHADRQFPITLVYDRFLRLLRRSFGFGTGVLILRATAREFDRLAGVLEADAAKYSTRAAEAEAAGMPLVAQRHKVARARAASHAMAFRRAGWTEFRQPLAPRADGTRKVVWQSAARRRLFEIFALIHWGLKIRICEAKEAARIEAQRGGRRPASGGHDVGNNNKQVCDWRALHHWRRCCVHKDLKRFCQPSICCWNGPRPSAAIFNKRCWVHRKMPYTMGHGH